MIAVSYWLPPDISAHGSDIDYLIEFLHYFMFALFAGWGVYFVYCLVKFRARPGHVAVHEDIKAKPSKYLEIVVVGIEAFLLIGISMPVWAYYRSEPPGPEDNPLEVRVVAQQFAWNIHYPGPDGKFGKTKPELINETTNPVGLDDTDPAAADDCVSINNFHIPKDRDILVRLTSKDVIHSFAVPLLRVKQDVIPGMEIPLWFKAVRTNDEVRAEMKRTVALPTSDEDVPAFVSKHKRDVAMSDYGQTGDGSPILAASGWIEEEEVLALRAAGVSEISIGPADPVNIQCAQLCGLGHYRMMGQMQIHEPEDFDKWYAEAGAEDEFFDEDEFEDEDE